MHAKKKYLMRPLFPLLSSYFLFLVLIFSSRQIFAQESVNFLHKENTDSVAFTFQTAKKTNHQKADSLDFLNPKSALELPVREKKFIRAGSEWFLTQAFPATFNRFITKDPYSYITFKNFVNNQRVSAWDWDDNQFSTNHIDHPYHGQLYFNSFRSNGYNLVQSSIATAAGSYIWETAGETQSPSINDFVNTTFGGVLLGEMLHRVSRNVIGRGRNGRYKKTNELAAFIINPVNGLNRLLDGKFASVDNYYTVDSSEIRASIDIGVSRFDTRFGNLLDRGKTSSFLRLKLQYSNGDHNYKNPFDQFDVNLEMGRGDSSLINAVNVHATLYGTDFYITPRADYYGLLTAHYDFYNNDAFFYGAQSINYNLMGEYKYKNSSLKTNLAGGAVLLAAVPDPYLLYGDSRNYNYGSGLGYRFNGVLNIGERLLFTANYNGGVFYTISGNESHYFLNALNLDMGIRFFKNLALTLNSGYFSLHGNFKDPELLDFDSEFPFARLSLGYSLLF